MQVSCNYCGKILERTQSRAAKYKTQFCNRKCFAKSKIKSRTYTCHVCQNSIIRRPSVIRSERIFCSRKCATIFNNKFYRAESSHPNWKNGDRTYRFRALSRYGFNCANSLCTIRAAGISIPEFMFDVDHIDSNRKNNKVENLQVLCVWCHALKTRASWGLASKNRRGLGTAVLAGIAQLAEHFPSKEDVAGSMPVARSTLMGS